MESETPVVSTPVPDTPKPDTPTQATQESKGWLVVGLKFNDEGKYIGINIIALFPSSWEAVEFLEDQKRRGLYRDSPEVVHAIIKNGTIIGKRNQVPKSS